MSNLPTHRPLRRVLVAVMGNLVLATLATAQFSSDTGDTGTGAGTGTGAATGGTSGFGSAMSASGSSSFAGVERGSTIGTENTSGFGAAAESTGAGGLGGGSAVGGRGGGVGGLGGLGGLFGALGGAFGGQESSSTQPTIRVKLRSAVDVPPLDSRVVQQSATRVLSRVPASTGVQNVQVKMDGRKATLTGIVRSEKERRMSELLMRLEPGVSTIDNQITVTR